MRVLLTESNTDGHLEVMEITEITYEDDITEVKDTQGMYDRSKETPVTGICMKNIHGELIYIEGVSQGVCDAICRQILKAGYADLSQLGEYKYGWEYGYQ